MGKKEDRKTGKVKRREIDSGVVYESSPTAAGCVGSLAEGPRTPLTPAKSPKALLAAHQADGNLLRHTRQECFGHTPALSPNRDCSVLFYGISFLLHFFRHL